MPFMSKKPRGLRSLPDGLEPRRCEDIKAIVRPEIGPKSFGTFEKQPPGHETLSRSGLAHAAVKIFLGMKGQHFRSRLTC